MIYLAVLAVGVVVSAVGVRSMSDIVKLLIPPLLIAVLVIGVLRVYARQIAKSTEYVITSRRFLLCSGVAFPIVINVPLRLIDEAGLHVFADGSGELQLRLSPQVKLAYVALWPHVETLRFFANPRPKLRGLADPVGVGQVLSDAIATDAEHAGLPVTFGVPAHRDRSSTTPRPTSQEAIAR